MMMWQDSRRARCRNVVGDTVWWTSEQSSQTACPRAQRPRRRWGRCRRGPRPAPGTDQPRYYCRQSCSLWLSAAANTYIVDLQQ
jgi:hypothetical protein